MIYADSTSRRIDVFAFDPEDGSVSDRRTFVDLDAGDVSVPDGLAVDVEDHVWVALWDGWAVHRYTPDGVLDRVVKLPVARPTSCAFGGDDLRRPVHHLGAHGPHARRPCCATGRRRRVRPSVRRPRTSAEPVRGLTVASRS